MKVKTVPILEPPTVKFRRHIQSALDHVEEAGKLIDKEANSEATNQQMFGLLDEVSDRIEALKYLIDPDC